MKISIAIMAHPSREKYVPYLKEKLGTDKVAIDKVNNIWETARRAWLMFDKDADYHFVIQDDSIVTSDFRCKLEQVIKRSSNNKFCYVLYAGRPRLRKIVKTVRERGQDHFVSKRIFNEVAIGLPTSVVEEMVAYCDSEGAINCRHTQPFIKSKKLLAYYPMPSLIDHRDEQTLHNMNKGNYVRKANWFKG